jgi:hypothetical protein
MEVLCVVVGNSDALNVDTAAVLVDALERAGAAAALASGGPALRGAAPAAAGRNVALCAFNTAVGDISLLYQPQPEGRPFDLRKWLIAGCKALTDMAAAGVRAPGQAAGNHGALRALAALLEAGAPAAWAPEPQSTGAMHHVTIFSATPVSHVDEDAITGALMDASAGHVPVHFVLVKQTSSESLGIRQELERTRACNSFLDVVSMSDNGTAVVMDATPDAMQSFALGLLLRERTPSGVPHLLGVLHMPMPLTNNGPRSVRLSLRPAVLPLHDIVEQVRVCRCHGRGVLCRDASIGADDVAHFLKLADKNHVCSVSAKRLDERDWIPNCVLVGRDAVVVLPSFYQPAFLRNDGSGMRAVLFSTHSTVALSGVTDAHLFGLPWEAFAPPDEDDELTNGAAHRSFDVDDDDAIIAAALAPGVSIGGGDATAAEANALHLGALAIALSRNDLGLVCSAMFNVDTGKATPFKCFYLVQAPHGLGSEGAATATPTLLLRRLAGREEVLPTPPMAGSARHITVGDVSGALETEVAASIAASLPMEATYDPLAHERGVHRIVSALVTKSLAPPVPMPPKEKKSAVAKQGSGRGSKRQKGT